eukprot:1161761-Pelagomonas_calceolata.AAC.11
MVDQGDHQQLPNGDVGEVEHGQEQQQHSQEQQLPNGNAEQKQEPEQQAGVQADGPKQKLDKKQKQKEKKLKHKQNRQQRRWVCWACSWALWEMETHSKLRNAQEQLKQPTASKEQRGFALHEQGATTDEDNVQIEYVSAPLDLGTSEKAEEPQPDEEAEGMGYGLGLGFSKPKEDPYADFKRIFERFATAEQVTGLERLGEESDEATASAKPCCPVCVTGGCGQRRGTNC